MSSLNQEPRGAEERAPELELNKETLQDLDLEPGDADGVKGGGSPIPSVGVVLEPTTMSQFGATLSIGSAMSRVRGSFSVSG